MVAMITTCVVNRTPQYHVFVEDALTCVCGQRKSFPSPPSYTLAELKVQAEEYVRRVDFITESEALTYELHLSMFLQWLAKREQGEGDKR